MNACIHIDDSFSIYAWSLGSIYDECRDKEKAVPSTCDKFTRKCSCEKYMYQIMKKYAHFLKRNGISVTVHPQPIYFMSNENKLHINFVKSENIYVK